MWAEDSVFWSITQATEVNGIQASLPESPYKFSKVREGRLRNWMCSACAGGKIKCQSCKWEQNIKSHKNLKRL